MLVKQSLEICLYGIPPPVWVLKFKSDIGFRKLTGGIVDQSNRYAGGGTQFVHPNKIRPITKEGFMKEAGHRYKYRMRHNEY